MTPATFCAMPLNFSFISPEKSLRASSTLRCSVFSFSSMVRADESDARHRRAVPGSLQVLLQRVDFVVLGFDLLLFWLELGVQLIEGALTFIGLADNGFKLDDRDLGGAGGAVQREPRGRRGLCCGLRWRGGSGERRSRPGWTPACKRVTENASFD